MGGSWDAVGEGEGLVAVARATLNDTVLGASSITGGST